MISTAEKSTRIVARIFEEADGYHISDDSLDYLDARGRAYPSRNAAIRHLREEAKYPPDPFFTHYTHYLSGSRIVKIQPSN